MIVIRTVPHTLSRAKMARCWAWWAWWAWWVALYILRWVATTVRRVEWQQCLLAFESHTPICKPNQYFFMRFMWPIHTDINIDGSIEDIQAYKCMEVNQQKQCGQARTKAHPQLTTTNIKQNPIFFFALVFRRLNGICIWIVLFLRRFLPRSTGLCINWEVIRFICSTTKYGCSPHHSTIGS